jgi:hypothetical protein
VLIVVLVLAFSGAIKAGPMADRRPKFDFVGAILSIFGWSTIVLGILLGQQYGFWLAKKPLVLGALEIAPFGLSVTPVLVGLGVLLVMLLVRWERRQEESGGDGLFKPSLLRTPGLPSGIAVRFVQMAIMAGFLFTGPLLMQLTFEFTAMQTGVALLPFSLALLVAAIVGARLSARFSAKRIIQAGLLIAVAGLVALEVTVQPNISAADLATGALFGAGIGLVASQILNLILSSVEAKDTAETTGINGTFEQLGNAIGVALVGAMMLGSLSGGLQQAITASPTFPPEEKPALIAAAQESVQLVANSQLEQTLVASGLTEAEQTELLDIYADARTQAFKAGLAFLIFATLAGLILTAGLPDRKLVDAEEPAAA